MRVQPAPGSRSQISEHAPASNIRGSPSTVSRISVPRHANRKQRWPVSRKNVRALVSDKSDPSRNRRKNFDYEKRPSKVHACGNVHNAALLFIQRRESERERERRIVAGAGGHEGVKRSWRFHGEGCAYRLGHSPGTKGEGRLILYRRAPTRRVPARPRRNARAYVG